LAPTLAQAFNPYLTSLTQDITIFAISIVISSQLYYFLINFRSCDLEADYNIFFITILCVAGITVKLSAFAFSGATLLVVVAVWLSKHSGQYKKRQIKVLLGAIVFNTILLAVWMVRGIILSGYVAFPSTLGSLPVTWRVPRPLALSEANWIYSWARAGGFWPEVLSNWNWLRPWLNYYATYEYTKPLVTALLGLVLYLITLARKTCHPARRHYRLLTVFVPPFIAVIFWFFSAPDPRFAGAYFWIFGAGFVALTIDAIDFKSLKTARILGCLLCLAFFVYLFPSHNSIFIPPNKGDSPFYAIPRPEYITTSINNLNGLNIPTKTDQCWNIPIPCTPYYRPSLHLRNEGLDSGFMLDHIFTFADMHQGVVPNGFFVSQGIGVALMGGAWHNFEEEKHIRWMNGIGKILVYTGYRTYVKLALKPVIINNYGNFEDEGQLKISLNNAFTTELPLKSGANAEVVIGLRPDFNVIIFELISTEDTSNGGNIDKTDAHSLSVAFQSIELTSIRFLK
jgi:hypothetical protein